MAETITTQSNIDPVLRPYLEEGLKRAQETFLTGPQPTFFPGQTYVSPSEQTLAALSQQEALARQASPALQQAQQSYLASLGQLGQTAAGGFLQGSPYQQQMIAAATRPLVQQYSEQVVPGIASGFSAAGRYGSGAMERAQAQAAERFARGLGDVTSQIVGQDYARERGLQQQAQLQQAALAQAAPSFFQMGLLPSQALATVGAAREQIAAQPLQEQIARFQFGQRQPVESLMSYLSSVYGTPLARVGTQSQQVPSANPFGQALGGGILGSQLGGLFPGGFGGFTGSQIGAGLGALGGLLF